MFKLKKFNISLSILLVYFGISAAYVNTTSQPIPNAVSFSPNSWLNITPGSDPSELCFSWATVLNNSTNFKYKPIFQADTTSVTYAYPVPKVQIVKIGKYKNPSITDFTNSNSVKTFNGVTLKSVLTESGTTKAAGWYQNKVTVSGLAQSSMYAYRVGYDTVWSGINTFKTHDPSSFSFIAVGDPQMGASTSGAHANSTQKANVEVYDSIAWQTSISTFTGIFPEASFILSCGDQIENTSSMSSDDREYTSYLAPLEMLGIPVATLCGNHDYGLGQYFGFHYNFPNQSNRYGATQYQNDGDYWFTYGNALFMMLNSNTISVTTHDVFIDQAIRANPDAKWRIVCFHHALFSNADHPFDSDVMFRRGTYPAIFDKYDIDVVFAGHDHQFSRSFQILNGVPVSKIIMRIAHDSSVTVCNPQGTVYMDLNSGSGSKYYDLNSKFIDATTGAITYPAYTAKFWQQYEPSFSCVKIDKNRFSIVTYAITDTNHPIDDYTIIKSRGPLPIRCFN